MHTFEWSSEDAPEDVTTFFADGYPRGGRVIIKKSEAVEMTVEADALFAFVAQAVREERIGVLEAASDAEVLGIPQQS